MALDKLVDSTQLDADLTSVANAIRTKGGTSASLAFPTEFVQAIADIPSGGGYTIEEIATLAEPSGDIVYAGTSMASHGLDYRSGIMSFTAPNVTTVPADVLNNCSNCTDLYFPELRTTTGAAFRYCGKDYSTGTAVFPKATSFAVRTFDRAPRAAVDIGPNYTGSFLSDCFYHNGGRQTIGALIIRYAGGVVPAATTDAINGLRDVYVPSALISSYEAATNWSTRVAGGYITFHAIEGSQYDGYWANGDPIA